MLVPRARPRRHRGRRVGGGGDLAAVQDDLGPPGQVRVSAAWNQSLRVIVPGSPSCPASFTPHRPPWAPGPASVSQAIAEERAGEEAVGVGGGVPEQRLDLSGVGA
ncbi:MULTISPECIES: hypothetical protein [unclassified Nocardiopsis]|uniref:hypothetical protein n=1 Tax=unclassified Nocardiopsis TaxID=2649073 RepID=UPI00135C0FD9|nr:MULTISPECIES: hypothetical protein [unclassified Nocardiopsis]